MRVRSAAVHLPGHWKPRTTRTGGLSSGPALAMVRRVEPIAQSVEHLPFKQRVPGSSPGRLSVPYTLRPRRLAGPRTLAFHASGTGSNPVGDTPSFSHSVRLAFWRGDACVAPPRGGADARDKDTVARRGEKSFALPPTDGAGSHQHDVKPRPRRTSSEGRPDGSPSSGGAQELTIPVPGPRACRKVEPRRRAGRGDDLRSWVWRRTGGCRGDACVAPTKGGQTSEGWIPSHVGAKHLSPCPPRTEPVLTNTG